MLPKLDGAALASVPLFPLPAVLFPGDQMPLHVFEPRYRRMIADVLAGSRLLSVPLVLPGAADEHGHPPIATVAGVGAIVEHTELSGGRYNILVRGLARARLHELPFEPPYRRARAEVLVPPETAVAEADRIALASAAARFVAIVRASDPSFEYPLPRNADAATLADVCARFLLLDPRDRQTALETLDPAGRVRRVTEALTVQGLPLEGSEGRGIN